MEHAREERNTKKIKKETFSPLLVLMMLMYPTLLGFVFAARLATFTLIIPTPTVPGAPVSSSSDSITDVGMKLRGAADLWETAGAGAIVRTGFALTSIAVVHLFLLYYLVRGPPGVLYMATHTGRVWTRVASLAFWLITTCFLLTYTSMARYGAHFLEWTVAGMISLIILVPTVLLPCTLLLPPSDAENTVVGYPPRAMV